MSLTALLWPLGVTMITLRKLAPKTHKEIMDNLHRMDGGE
jgi:hypothetical protein